MLQSYNVKDQKKSKDITTQGKRRSIH